MGSSILTYIGDLTPIPKPPAMRGDYGNSSPQGFRLKVNVYRLMMMMMMMMSLKQ